MKNALIVNCSPVQSGATDRIAALVTEYLCEHFQTKRVCIADYSFSFCLGCRACHATGKCILPEDGVQALMAEYDWADAIVCVAPSYWADVPGQFKAFIDRCTPWCNTHEPHAVLQPGKQGYAIALRTGPSMRECTRIIETIEHFHGHLEIESRGSLGLCSIENRQDVELRKEEIEAFCEGIIRQN